MVKKQKPVKIQVNVSGKPKQPKKSGKPPAKAKRESQMRRPATSTLQAYLRLLNDPCGGDFVNAPYGGMESGYMCRTTDIISLSNAVGFPTATKMNFMVSYVPNLSNTSTTGEPFVQFSCGTTGTSSSAVLRPVNFVTNNVAVGKYRPIAACLKFIPIGDYATRSGEIALGTTSAGHIIKPATGGQNGLSTLALALKRLPNGGGPTELKWLPNSADALWIDDNNTYPIPPGTGIYITGINIDAIAGVVQGYIEATTVWEWMPESTATNLATAPRAPHSFTIQDALSKIGDVATFMTHPTIKDGLSLLSTGYKAYTTARPGMPRVQR